MSGGTLMMDTSTVSTSAAFGTTAGYDLPNNAARSDVPGDDAGGGIATTGGSVTLTNVQINGNTAEGRPRHRRRPRRRRVCARRQP